MTGLAESGSSGLYLTEDALCENINPNAPKFVVGTDTVSIQTPPNVCTIAIENIPMDVKQSQTMPIFKNS